jgi:dUTP pyrophosphatase
MSNFPNLLVKRLTKTATLPTRAHDTDAGLDLYADELVMVAKRDKSLISTGISIGLPPNTMGKIFSRSGIAWKNGIQAGAGVIDEGFRSDVKVLLFNNTDKDFFAEPGTKIAQLVIIPVYYSQVQEVDELTETERGAGGFGSSDKKVEVAKSKENSKNEMLEIMNSVLAPVIKQMSNPEEGNETDAMASMMQQMLGLIGNMKPNKDKDSQIDKVD